MVVVPNVQFAVASNSPSVASCFDENLPHTSAAACSASCNLVGALTGLGVFFVEK